MIRVLHGERGVYQLLEPSGSGGLSTVYRARDQTGHIVAVKLSGGDPARADRFRAEVDVMVRIAGEFPGAHELLRLIDRGDAPRPFVVLEFYEHTLSSVLGAGLPLLMVLDLLTQAARAVALLHGDDHGPSVVHGDVKPQNLLVRHLGQRPQVVLGDLGGCEWTTDPPTGRQRPFSPWYSPPEVLLQAHGAADPRGDGFSLAVVVFEAITTVHPRVASPDLAWLGAEGRELLALQRRLHGAEGPDGNRDEPGLARLEELQARSIASRVDAAPEPLTGMEQRRLLHALEDGCRASVPGERLLDLPEVLAAELTPWLVGALRVDPGARPAVGELVGRLQRAHDRLAGRLEAPSWQPVHPSTMPTQLAAHGTGQGRPGRGSGPIVAMAVAGGLAVLGATMVTVGLPDGIGEEAGDPSACVRGVTLTTRDADLTMGLDAGPRRTFFGSTLRTLADVNGDGLDELVVGSRKSDPLLGGVGWPGATHVYLSPLALDREAMSVEDASVTIVGANRRGAGIMGGVVDTAPGVPMLAMGDFEASTPPSDGHVWLLRDLTPGVWSRDDVGHALPSSTVMEGDGAYFGSSVAVGHVDGDEHADVFVAYSAMYSDDVGHIWYGPIDPGTRPVSEDGGLTLAGEPEAQAGSYAVDFADVSGDGVDDLILAPRHTNLDFSRLVVLAGTQAPRTGSVDIRDLLDGTQGMTVQGPAGSGFGRTVQAAGDFDDDGSEDLIVTERDGARILFGPLLDGRAEVRLDDTVNFRIADVPSSPSYGNGGWGVGDLDRDGFDDIVVCGAGASFELGACWLIFGNSRSALPYRMSTSWVVLSIRGMAFRNEHMDTRWFGQGAVGTDLDGDGFPELILSGYPGVFVYAGPVCPALD